MVALLALCTQQQHHITADITAVSAVRPVLDGMEEQDSAADAETNKRLNNTQRNKKLYNTRSRLRFRSPSRSPGAIVAVIHVEFNSGVRLLYMQNQQNQQ